MIARIGIIASSMVNSSFDPDAQSFISAAGYTNVNLQTAINTLVTGLKSQSLWDKLYFAYPFATDATGGTNADRLNQMKYNLKNTSQYTLTYFNTPTATTTGLGFNGSTQYADTGLNVSTVYGTSNSASIGIYSTTNNAGVVVDIGATITNYHCLFIRYTGDLFYAGTLNSTTLLSATNANSTGLYISSRLAAGVASHSIYKNGVLRANEAGTQTLGRDNATMYIGAGNRGGPQFYANRSYCFAFGGAGLTNTEVTNLSLLINTFQGDVETALSLAAGTRKRY